MDSFDAFTYIQICSIGLRQWTQTHNGDLPPEKFSCIKAQWPNVLLVLTCSLCEVLINAWNFVFPVPANKNAIIEATSLQWATCSLLFGFPYMHPWQLMQLESSSCWTDPEPVGLSNSNEDFIFPSRTCWHVVWWCSQQLLTPAERFQQDFQHGSGCYGSEKYQKCCHEVSENFQRVCGCRCM